MSKLVGSSFVFLILTVSVTAQIQKSSNNRVYVDEDYKYTEEVRRTRGFNEQFSQGLKFHMAGDYRDAANAFDAATKFDPSAFEAHYNLGIARYVRFHGPTSAKYFGSYSDAQLPEVRL